MGRRTDHVPHDRLTGIANDVLAWLEEHPEYHDVRAVVMLEDDDGAGIGIHGYKDMVSALTSILMNVKVIAESLDKTVDFVFLHDDGVERIP